MAFATVTFENKRTGQIRQAPAGFSWTTLFFGFFPALFRQHWVGALIQFLIACISFGLSGLIFMFIYNKMYIKHLIGEGFVATQATMTISEIENRIGLRLPKG